MWVGRKGETSALARQLLKGAAVLLLLSVLMLWLAGVFVRKVQPGPAAEKRKLETPKTWTVQRVSYPLVVEQTGTVRGKVEALVSSRIMAQVEAILVQEGQDVTGADGSGEPTLLARLDNRDVEARLRQAESQLLATEKGVETAKAKFTASRAQVVAARANAEKSSLDFKRIEALAGQNVATRQQLDHIRAQRDSTEAQVQASSREVQAAQSEIERMEAMRDAARAAMSEARANLAYTRVYAPFSGKLVKKLTDIGNMASPGQPLFLIETDRQPELHAALSESLLHILEKGQQLEVEVDALHRSFTGVLCDIVPQSDPGTRTVLVKISLPPDPQLVNGLFGRLKVVHGQYSALTIPAAAVRETGQLRLVDVLDSGGHASRRFVTLGRRHDSFVEVLSGISEKDEVVLP